jgi:ribonucleoside-diphosphate reductase beta chain
MSTNKFTAINWNDCPEFDLMIWNQNKRQIWFDTEISLSDDKNTWSIMTVKEQDTYKKVLGGLTLLDTQQSLVGMPMIMLSCNDLFQKSIMTFMSMMETVHAKSYSSIFSTLCTTNEINDIFDWTETNIYLVEKMRIVLDVYNNMSKYSLSTAMATSVMLESFLFYSGFFYPLYLAANGKLTNSNEIINLIVRDEAVHGIYIGQLAQQQKNYDEKLIRKIFNDLLTIELEYCEYLYKDSNLVREAQNFVRYNANKAFMNLGLDVPFCDLKESDVNPMVIKGLDTQTKNQDFFSKKGNGYIKAEVVKTNDDDFDF